MAKKRTTGKSTAKDGGSRTTQKRAAKKPATISGGKPSSLLDTRVIYCGDCLEKLADLPDNCVDLIYIDPPFNSNADYFSGGVLFAEHDGTPAHAQFRAFEDTWWWDTEAAQLPQCCRTPPVHGRAS